MVQLSVTLVAVAYNKWRAHVAAVDPRDGWSGLMKRDLTLHDRFHVHRVFV